MAILKPEDLILLLVCVAAGLLGMTAKLLGTADFKNGGFFFRKIILSIFLVVTIFLSADTLASL